MRLRSILLGSAFAVACGGAFGGAAQAAHINGWYLGLEGGGNWIEDWSHIQNPGANVRETSYDTGWLALATVGYSWGSHLRVEFEAGYRDNEVDAISNAGGVPQPGFGGDLWEASAMVNVLYDLHLTDKMSVSLGAGAGGDFANSNFVAPAGSSEDDEWNLAYQGIVGLNYMIAQRTALFLNYRYFRAVSPEFDYRPGVNFLQNSSDDFVKHAATFGIRYALYAAPSYVDNAPPPAGPSSSAPPRQFIVFFGFNKYNLTSEALRVISEAVVAAKETGSASILITGHTDTVGSNGYNERLSMRRSNVVKGEMVRQGISTSSISANGKGETELLVQTADGVKEPQNRRSSIDLN